MKLSLKQGVLAALLLLNGAAYAQLPDVSSLPGMDSSNSFSMQKFVKDAVKISGDIGMNGDAYSVSGKPSTRPGGTGRIFFRPSINVLDRFTLNFDFFLSTEGNSARQNINTAKFSPEWSWGKVNYGDFGMELSKFTVTDINIKGYGIDLFPGSFKFQAFSGKSQKAVVTDASGSMYERQVYGGKIGYGEQSAAHIHLNFFRAYDKKSSVPHDLFRRIDTVATGGGLRVDTNYTGVTPQENLITGLNWGFGLLENAIKMKGEVALSLFTRDTYSPTVTSKDIPAGMDNYYTPRLTSSGDIAYSGEASYQDRTVQLRGGYTLIGPGYTSLGMSSFINDKQIITGGAGINLLQGDLAIQSNFQLFSDNVAKQKRFTTDRNNYMVSVSVRPMPALMVSVNTNINTIGNGANNDTLKIDMHTASFGLNSTYQFEAWNYKHVLTGGFNSQGAESKSVVRGNSKITSQNVNLGMTTTFTKQTSASVTATLGFMDMGVNGTANTQSYAARVNQKMLEDKLTNSLSYSLVNAKASMLHILGFQSAYQVFESSTISFNTRGTFYRGKGAKAINFSESLTTLDWSYRF